MLTHNKKMLIKAVTRLMRPLVQLLLHNGLLYREFTDMAKHVFFGVGQDILTKQQSKLTSSQLSVLTGLHRKDVAAFLENTPSDELDDQPASVGAAVIAEWITRPSLLDKKGKPIALPYAQQDNKSPSFTTLVESVSKDIRPKAHLEELLRLGLVTVDEAHVVQLRREAFLPSEDFSGKLEFFVRNVGDHLLAASTNMQETPPRHFDRSAFHGQLSESDVLALRQWVEERGMETLKEFYRKAEELSTAAQAQSPKTAKKRVTFGIYFYNE